MKLRIEMEVPDDGNEVYQARGLLYLLRSELSPFTPAELRRFGVVKIGCESKTLQYWATLEVQDEETT